MIPVDMNLFWIRKNVNFLVSYLLYDTQKIFKHV